MERDRHLRERSLSCTLSQAPLPICSPPGLPGKELSRPGGSTPEVSPPASFPSLPFPDLQKSGNERGKNKFREKSPWSAGQEELGGGECCLFLMRAQASLPSRDRPLRCHTAPTSGTEVTLVSGLGSWMIS